jgi:hypothetical protein
LILSGILEIRKFFRSINKGTRKHRYVFLCFVFGICVIVGAGVSCSVDVVSYLWWLDFSSWSSVKRYKPASEKKTCITMTTVSYGCTQSFFLYFSVFHFSLFVCLSFSSTDKRVQEVNLHLLQNVCTFLGKRSFVLRSLSSISSLLMLV